MLAIDLKFPNGKYHATPWNRHVNEGEVEWPPSPWRILRAVISVYHRTIDQKRFPEDVLLSLINNLSAEHPEYALPYSKEAHTRHYMPIQKNIPRMIFDAFKLIDPEDSIIVVWPNITLQDNVLELFDEILMNLDYLGRSESIVDVKRLEGWSGVTNCKPLLLSTGPTDRGSISLIVPFTPGEFKIWKQGYRAGLSQNKTNIFNTPGTLYDVLTVRTNELRKEGWAQPPGGQWIDYAYLEEKSKVPVTRARTNQKQLTLARWQLIGNPLPRVEQSILIGEVLRSSLIKKCDFLGLEIPGILTGRDEHGEILKNGHQHAFYLPEDLDNDGYIDHITMYIQNGMPAEIYRAIEEVKELAIYADGQLKKWNLLFESMGDSQDFKALPIIKESKVWESSTPYIHPWHVHKNRFGADEQLRKELILKGYKDFTLTPIDSIEKKGKQIKSWQFNLMRRRKPIISPDRSGSFWRIEFNEPVSGPIAIGHGCHFGLGLFFSK